MSLPTRTGATAASGEERVASPTARAPFRSTSTDRLRFSLANEPPSDPRVITGVAARIENASLPSSFREKKCVLAWRDEAKKAGAPNITHGVEAREDGRAARLGEALPAPEVARAP